jgi:hypothetical protein
MYPQLSGCTALVGINFRQLEVQLLEELTAVATPSRQPFKDVIPALFSFTSYRNHRSQRGP